MLTAILQGRLSVLGLRNVLQGCESAHDVVNHVPCAAARPTFFCQVYKNSVPNSQRTPSMSIIKTIRLRLLRNVITVYFKTHKKQKCVFHNTHRFSANGKETNSIELSVWAGVAQSV